MMKSILVLALVLSSPLSLAFADNRGGDPTNVGTANCLKEADLVNRTLKGDAMNAYLEGWLKYRTRGIQVRIVTPTDLMSTDLEENRLNVLLDNNNEIVEAHCG